MRLLILEFLFVIALNTYSVLSHVSENNGGTIANNSLVFRTTTTDEMTTFINTSGIVWHMEPDLHLHGNVIFADHNALKSTNGITTSTLAGSPSTSGNTVAVGQLARFGFIRGFRQISPLLVVVADSINHCLRLVDRLTLQTPWYAGYCGSGGYSQGTTSARFDKPWQIILDKKRAGMLLVTDYHNDAIRHVQVTVGSGLSAVSEFYKSSTLDTPVGLTQDPISGDLFITTFTHKVFRLTYTTRFLSLLAGSSSGFADGDFGSSRFYHPTEIVLIDHGRRIILADQSNHQLRLLDLITRQTPSLCTGQHGHSDGDMSSCTLNYPRSLMVLNNTLYVGEYQRIRKLQDACVNQEFDVSPDTGLALVEVPGSRGTIKLSLSPGSHPFYLTFPTASCTVEFHVNDRRQLACPNPEIQESASSDTGLAVVDVPLCESRTGKLSLPPGNYPLNIESDTFNCTVEYNISDYRDSPCANLEVRQIASAVTGIAQVDMSWSGFNGRMKLPPGNYQLEILERTQTCTVDIGIADHRLRRRLVFEANYDVECEPEEGNIAESPLTLTVARHTFTYQDICATDCTSPEDAEIELSCTNHTLTVVWPSNLTYTGDVNRIPAELDQRLTSRIVAKGAAFVMFLPELNPPVVFPEQQDNGGFVNAKLTSHCIAESFSYVKVTDSCEQQTDSDIPDM